MESSEHNATWDQRQIFQQRLHNGILRYQQSMEEVGNLIQAASALDSVQGEVLGWIHKSKDKEKNKHIEILEKLSNDTEKKIYVYSTNPSFATKHYASKAVRKWYFELCKQMHQYGLIMQSMKNTGDMFDPMNVG